MERPIIDHLATLRQRHPSFVGDDVVRAWFRRFNLSDWCESPLPGNLREVVLLDRTGLEAIVGLLGQPFQEHSVQDRGSISVSTEVLLGKENITLKESETRQAAIESVAQHFPSGEHRVVATRPVVRGFVGFAPIKLNLSWQIQVVNNNRIYTFRYMMGKSLVTDVMSFVAHSIPAFHDPEDLSTNEIHHPKDWIIMAQSWTQWCKSNMDSALRIKELVCENMTYDTGISNVFRYVLSDYLTINQNHWRGVCGEFAVVQVSLLRALGIPSVLKWITYQHQGKTAAHACVEFDPGDGWRHMDACWNSFDDPSVYRNSGLQDIKAMDVCCPRATGTGMCDHYTEFCVNPSYPGSPRQGYSH